MHLGAAISMPLYVFKTEIQRDLLILKQNTIKKTFFLQFRLYFVANNVTAEQNVEYMYIPQFYPKGPDVHKTKMLKDVKLVLDLKQKKEIQLFTKCS